MLNKEAYSIQMNFGVPDSEKETATKAKEHFEKVLKKLQDAGDYLDLIYTPFKKNESVDMETLIEFRKTFRQYRDAVDKKYKEIIKNSYKSIALMNEFGIDTATEELMDSFVSSIKRVRKNILIHLYQYSLILVVQSLEII